MNKPLILIVEDDPPIRNLISVALEAHDYRYISAANAGNAIMEATSHNPDIVLLDLGLPDLDGVDVIRKIRSWSNMPIIVRKCGIEPQESTRMFSSISPPKKNRSLPTVLGD